MFFQLTGLSGSGKTTLAYEAKALLAQEGWKVEVIDGDEYRKTVCADLGFSREDRIENIKRLGEIANKFAAKGFLVILAAINPFEESRRKNEEDYKAQTIWIDCDLETLIKRDTKGLYKRALLPLEDPNRLANLTGIDDAFEMPDTAVLKIDTSQETVITSAKTLSAFILSRIAEDGWSPDSDIVA